MDLLANLGFLTQYGAGPVSIAAGVLARVSLLVFLLPGLGERTISTRIRLTVALAVTAMLTPLVMDAAPAAPTSASGMALLIAAEAMNGAVLGFSVRVAVFTLQTAGSMASQHISLAQLFGSALDGQMEPPVATLFMFAGIALAVAAGLHFKAVEALAVTYEVMPFGAFPAGGDTAGWAVAQAASSFSAGLSLAMPFVVLGVIYNLAIGAANRAMPQLMVAFVGAPAITLAGLAMIALATPVVLAAWMEMVDAIFAALLGGAP